MSFSMHRFTVDGRWYTITVAAKTFGVSPQLIRNRLRDHGNELTAEHMKQKVKRTDMTTGLPRRNIEDIKVGSWERANLLKGERI